MELGALRTRQRRIEYSRSFEGQMPRFGKAAGLRFAARRRSGLGGLGGVSSYSFRFRDGGTDLLPGAHKPRLVLGCGLIKQDGFGPLQRC